MKKSRNAANKRSKNDSIIVRGNVELPINTNVSGNGVIGGISYYDLSPSLLGGRPAVFNGLFSRYRFLSLTIKYVNHVGSNTAGALAIGFLDDTVGASSELFSDYLATVQLRVVLETSVWVGARTRWTPINPSTWYYTQVETSTGDNRLVNQLGLVGNGVGLSASTIYGSLIVSYVLQFEGAMPNSTS